MPTLKQHKKRWKRLLKTNQWLALFESMDVWLDEHGDTRQKDNFVLLESWYRGIYDKEMKGNLTLGNAQAEYQRIRQSLLFFINELEEAREEEEEAPKEKKEALLRRLKLRHPLGPYYLVNCNREKPFEVFHEAFCRAEEEDRRAQFYFTVGCQTEEPEGFAERIVFEMMEQEQSLGGGTASDMDVVHYQRVPDNDERVLILPLPKILSLQNFQERFKKYIAERFNLGTRSFEDFLQNDLPLRQEKYIAVPFGMVSNNWNRKISAECFQWLLDTFKHVNKGPKWIFIFVFWIVNVHRPEKMRNADARVFEEIKAFIKKNEEHIAFLYPLEEVEDLDVKIWFEDISDMNTFDKESLISLYVQGLSEEERKLYESEKLLHMERVEEIQEDVYHFYIHGRP